MNVLALNDTQKLPIEVTMYDIAFLVNLLVTDSTIAIRDIKTERCNITQLRLEELEVFRWTKARLTTSLKW